jgi:branched-subunit amino acid transport protein AzlD
MFGDHLAFFGKKRSDTTPRNKWEIPSPGASVILALISGFVNSPCSITHSTRLQPFVFFEEPEHPEFNMLVAVISTAPPFRVSGFLRIYAKQEISAEKWLKV